jgi:uncharacterized membrane protein
MVPATRAAGANRDPLEVFSDGVFAIVVTLPVLELKVPALTHHRSFGDLGPQLLWRCSRSSSTD